MKTTALQTVAAGRGETVNLNTLRALATRGLVALTVRTVRYTHRGATVKEIDVTVSLTDAGRVAVAS